MTTKRATDPSVAPRATPTTLPDFLPVDPFDEDGDNLCPEPEAIVRFLLRAPGTDPTLEHHFLVCSDCRIEVDAMREAIRRLGEDDDIA